MKGEIDGQQVALGNRVLDDLKGDRVTLRRRPSLADGQTVMFVVIDDKAQVWLASQIQSRKHARSDEQLHEEGIRIVMLTGDSRDS